MANGVITIKAKTMKRYIISSTITFLTAFALYFVTVVDTVTIESFSNGALAGMLFVGARAGIKALLEYLLLETATK